MVYGYGGITTHGMYYTDSLPCKSADHRVALGIAGTFLWTSRAWQAVVPSERIHPKMNLLDTVSPIVVWLSDQLTEGFLCYAAPSPGLRLASEYLASE
jgi:hypothetical protein